MAQEPVKRLWGKEFRVVPQGLAETDVFAFLEGLMGEHRESMEKLEHLDLKPTLRYSMFVVHASPPRRAHSSLSNHLRPAHDHMARYLATGTI